MTSDREADSSTGTDADERLWCLAIEGVEAEVRSFASGDAGSRIAEGQGWVASVVPVNPERSLPNSVYVSDHAGFAAAYEEVDALYAEAGVRAWTVWVPDRDRDTARLLESRGHAFDGAPRAMALWLSDLSPAPPEPEGAVVVHPGEHDHSPLVAARLNDLAYGLDPSFELSMHSAGEPEIRFSYACSAEDGEPLACVGAIAAGEGEDDVCISLVATRPDAQRRGLAGRIMWEVLDRARAAGVSTGSLQASKAGAPVYERLGLRDLGAVELWEKRAGSPTE